MLTTRMQIQAIANRLAGLPATVGAREKPLKAAAFSEPWKSCWKALDKAAPGQEHSALIQAAGNFSEGEWVIERILSARPGARLGRFLSLAELADSLPKIEWVWPGWVPRGMITLLGSAPGAGKSFVALDLARRVLQREGFPDGLTPERLTPNPSPGPGEGSLTPGGSPMPGEGRKLPRPPAGEGWGEGRACVIYVDAEAVPQLLYERARSWQMDVSHLHLLLPEPGEMVDFGLAAHRDRLVEMAAELSPELIIVDSLSSVSSKSENNVEDVRTILGFLNELARDTNSGLLLIHHLRKRSNLQPKPWELNLNDFRGSSHITAMARSVMGLSVIPTQEGQERNGLRKLEIIKTNLGAYPEPLGFEFEPLYLKGVRLKWGQPASPYLEPTQLEKCKAWLENVLRQDGEKRAGEIARLGEEAGFSRAMIYRARAEMGELVEDTRGHKHPGNAWRWAG
jgi:hypothetical protein